MIRFILRKCWKLGKYMLKENNTKLGNNKLTKITNNRELKSF